MNVYSSAALRAKEDANSKIVETILKKQSEFLIGGFCGGFDSQPKRSKLLILLVAGLDLNQRPLGYELSK